MVHALVILIAIANCALLLLFSFFAVGGDGSADGLRTVRTFGFVWIGAFAVLSLVLSVRGKRLAAVLAAVMALPTAYLAGLGAISVGIGFAWLRPNSPAFEALCEGAGTKFVAQPSAPVRSIAYDWEGQYAPQYNYFELGLNGNVEGLRGGSGLAPYPKAIQFIESRCCRYEGRPTNGTGAYLRRPRDGEYFGVSELTADALVILRSTPVQREHLEPGVVQYDVVVTDRRHGTMLASLRYFLNAERRRACGATSEGVMDERAFVLTAVGVK